MARKQYQNYRDELKSAPEGVTTNFLNSYFGHQGINDHWKNNQRDNQMNGRINGQYRVNVSYMNLGDRSAGLQGTNRGMNGNNLPKCQRGT